MLIAFSSDHHHHNYTAFSRTLPGGMNSRVAEMLAVEAHMTEVMKRRGVKVHVRGGDLFDRKNQIDAVVFSEVAQAIYQNKEAGIEEVIVKGNHDLAAGGTRNSLEALEHVGNVRIIPRCGGDLYGSLALRFVAYDDDPEVQREQIKTFAKEITKGNKHNLLVAHCQIHGCKSGSEYVLPGNLTTDDLCLSAWDYIFLGHVHEPQWLTKKALYIGSMSQRSFQDEGSARRMLLLDTESMKLEEVPLPGPMFYSMEIHDLDELRDFQSDAKTVYLKIVVRSNIKTKEIDALLDGRCAGWLVTHALDGPAAPPRISAGLTRWEDIMTQYVDQAATSLDRTRLLQIGEQLRTEAADAA